MRYSTTSARHSRPSTSTKSSSTQKKCVFGVPAGKLLGYMVSARGIEANPKKVQEIAKMQDPTNIKGVQQLTGRLAALSRFISRLGERTLPFYQLLRKGEKFEWTEEAC